MPRPHAYNPLLKSYPDSEKINAVSEGAETLYTRLLAICDDNACFWGDPKLVLVKAYSQRWAGGQLVAEDVEARLEELRAVELIRFYHHGDRAYLQVLNCFKTLRKDVKRICLFPEPPAPATAVQIREAAEGQEEPQEGTEALFQTGQEGDGRGPDAARTRPRPGPDTAAQKRPDQTRPEGEAPSLNVLIDPLAQWKGRDTGSTRLGSSQLHRIRGAIAILVQEFQLDDQQEAVNLLGRACFMLLQQKNSPQWTNIAYALGCIRLKVRELREGRTNGRIKRQPDEIREDNRRQQADEATRVRQENEKKTLDKRRVVEEWFLNKKEEYLEPLRREAMREWGQLLSRDLLSGGDCKKSPVLREIMFDIAHETEAQEAKL